MNRRNFGRIFAVAPLVLIGGSVAASGGKKRKRKKRKHEREEGAILTNNGSGTLSWNNNGWRWQNGEFVQTLKLRTFDDTPVVAFREHSVRGSCAYKFTIAAYTPNMAMATDMRKSVIGEMSAIVSRNVDGAAVIRGQMGIGGGSHPLCALQEEDGDVLLRITGHPTERMNWNIFLSRRFL